MEIVVRVAAAAAVITFLLLVGRRSTALAGLAAWIPAITLAGLFLLHDGWRTSLVATDVSQERAFLRASMFAVPVWFAFALTTYVALRYTTLAIAVAIGLVVWLVAAVAFVRLFN